MRSCKETKELWLNEAGGINFANFAELSSEFVDKLLESSLILSFRAA